MTITLRTDKGFPLTYEELDGNFTDLDTRLGAIETANVVSVNGKTGAVTLTTTDVAEGTNTYYTNARFDARFAASSTSTLPEGTNLYLTAARIRANISVGAGLTYDSGAGVITFTGNTDVVSEGGSRLYFTNARADARIALANASALADVEYPTSPINGDVLTWNTSTSRWEPIQPPGAAGGEINTASNIGSGGQGLFATKVGADLRFYSLAVGNGMSISAPSANIVTISTDQDLRTSGIVTFGTLTLNNTLYVGNTTVTNNSITTGTTNGNLSIKGNNTGYVVVDAGAGLSVTSGSIFTPNVKTFSNANLNLTPNGTGQVVISNAVISTLTSGRITYSTTNSTLTDSANLTFDGSTVTVTGNLTATVVNAGNIRSTVDTITTLATNGNINITATGTGSVILNTVKVSDLTSGRVTYATTSGKLNDNANLTFDGTTLTTTGNITVTNTVNAAAVISGNIKANANQIISTNTNGNINIAPNGTGLVGVNTASPSYLLHVNGSFGSNSAVIANNITVGTTATSDTVTLTARLASSLVPATTNSYDLGTNTLKLRHAYLAGNFTLDGNATFGDSSADTITLNATLSSIPTPTADNTYDIGTNTLRWKDLYLSGDVSFGGGDIISTAATANIVNVTATTVNFAGAATALTIGSTAAGNLVIQNPITVFGNGTTNGAPQPTTIKGTNGTGLNVTAGNLTIAAGAGTGIGPGGKLVFQYATAGASGSSLNAYVNKMYIDDSINVIADIIPTTNASRNLGSTSYRFNNVWGVSSSALYADLAERYHADAEYDEGTVLVFGGEREITTTDQTADTAVAGVVSTHPAYVMNDDGQDPREWPAIALRGKVPVKVIGKVDKGDLLVTSSIKGYAVSVGKVDRGNSVFAKSIEHKDTEELGTIMAVIL